MLSYGLPSNPLKIIFFPLWETVGLLSQFSEQQPPKQTAAAKCVFNRSLIGVRHTSPTVE